jgi:hypothetical protein
MPTNNYARATGIERTRNTQFHFFDDTDPVLTALAIERAKLDSPLSRFVVWRRTAWMGPNTPEIKGRYSLDYPSGTWMGDTGDGL